MQDYSVHNADYSWDPAAKPGVTKTRPQVEDTPLSHDLDIATPKAASNVRA